MCYVDYINEYDGIDYVIIGLLVDVDNVIDGE